MILYMRFAYLAAKPLNRSEAKVDLFMVQTLLIFKCKFLFLSCVLDTGLYLNKVTFSLTPNQRSIPIYCCRSLKPIQRDFLEL